MQFILNVLALPINLVLALLWLVFVVLMLPAYVLTALGNASGLDGGMKISITWLVFSKPRFKAWF